ncbi:MAG TPA: hypothetical protein VJ373_05935, partial [Desulfatiglandales bacterium]|nr:hypothetical protein [Desulfatiglandales bacterium]
FADEELLEYVVDFLQTSHEANERYTVRDGINIARYALKRLYGSGERMTSADRKTRILDYMKESASMILDQAAAEYFHDLMEDPYEEE